MSFKGKKFTDDGWAIWIDGDDTSTVYFNNWMNPKGKSYVDVSLKIAGIKNTKSLNLYVPFSVTRDEIEDISHYLKDEYIARAVFSTGCVIDYMKNEYTSEIAFNAKTMDIIHASKLDMVLTDIEEGTLISIDYSHIQPYIENEEGYFSLRFPHKSLDNVFRIYKTPGSFLKNLHEILTTPIVSQKYGYSVRVNEARLLPAEINKKGVYHRQKLKKAVISISINEAYEVGDSNCFRVRRLEEDLYKNFVPKDFKRENVITYQWKESRDEHLRGHFNFYFNLARNLVSAGSIVIYVILILIFGIIGDASWDLIKLLFNINL